MGGFGGVFMGYLRVSGFYMPLRPRSERVRCGGGRV